MTIYEKILAVMQAVEYLQKDKMVETGNGRGYKAITDEKVLSAIRPAMIAVGLIMLPIKMEQQRTDETVQAYDAKGRPVEKINRITTVNATYRIINTENPAEFVDIVSAGTGVDTQDKGVGKAMTYAKKYAILNSFLIPSGEDTDQISSDLYTDALIGKPADTQTGFATDKAQQSTPPEPVEPPASDLPKSDRKINIAMACELAKKGGFDNLINEKGYNGKPWDELSDEQVVKVKLWAVQKGKKQ